MDYKSQHSGPAIDKAVADIQSVDLQKLNHYLGIFSDLGTRPVRGKQAGDYCYVGVSTDCDEHHWNGHAWTIAQTHLNLVGEVNNIVQELGNNPRVAISQMAISQIIRDIVSVDKEQTRNIDINANAIVELQNVAEFLNTLTTEHDNTISEHGDTLDNHQVELDEHSQVLENHQTELANHDESISSLNDDIERIDNTAKEQQEQIGSNTTRITAVENRSSALEQQTTELNARTSELESKSLRYKGVFADASLLPTDAMAGDYAYVGTDTTALVVYTFGASWSATGEIVDLATVSNLDNIMPEDPSEHRAPTTALLASALATQKAEQDAKLTELEQEIGNTNELNTIINNNVIASINEVNEKIVKVAGSDSYEIPLFNENWSGQPSDYVLSTSLFEINQTNVDIFMSAKLSNESGTYACEVYAVSQDRTNRKTSGSLSVKDWQQNVNNLKSSAFSDYTHFIVSIKKETDNGEYGARIVAGEVFMLSFKNLENLIPSLRNRIDDVSVAQEKTDLILSLYKSDNPEEINLFGNCKKTFIDDAHSSADDRIRTYVKKGSPFYVRLTPDEDFISSQVQVYLFDSEENILDKKTITDFSYNIEFTSSQFLSYEGEAYIGVYYAQQERKGTLHIEIVSVSTFDRLTKIESDCENLPFGIFTIIGQGNNIARQKLKLRKNKSYIISFKNKVWDISGVTVDSSYSLLVIGRSLDGVETNNVNVKLSQTMADSYAITADESDYYYVGVRATQGVIVEFQISEDVDTSEKRIKEALVQMNKTYVANEELKNPQCVLLHFSDIHSSSENLKRIVSFYNDNIEYITDVICTGDVVRENIDEDDSGYSGFSYWHNSGADSFLIAVGNHDSRKESTGNSATDFATEVYPVIYKPFISQWGVVQPTDAEVKGLCYYYKDYVDSKLRLIVLDGTPQSKDGDRFDETQQAWFANVLLDAKSNGYAVICANHYGFRYPSVATRTKNVFDALLVGAEESVWSINESASILVDDFIADGGEFVCWIAGHTHRDEFSILKEHNKQAVINIAESAISNGAYGDIVRTKGTQTQDCFNLLSVDTNNKTFSIYRVGANFDRTMRKRESLCWSYANNELVWQS